MRLSLNPQCLSCKHYRGDDACEAFPEGIPGELLLDDWDHRFPYPGDNGIVFEPLPGSPPRLPLEQVRQRSVPGRNALDETVSQLHGMLRFESPTQAKRFTNYIGWADTFNDLPAWCQEIIREASR